MVYAFGPRNDPLVIHVGDDTDDARGRQAFAEVADPSTRGGDPVHVAVREQPPRDALADDHDELVAGPIVGVKSRPATIGTPSTLKIARPRPF